MNFNSRPSARGDRVARLSCRAFRHFNSRPSARGDTRHPNSAVHPPYFNSRPSARGDVVFSLRHKEVSYFNSRPSARGDGGRIVWIQCFLSFQFTPLREGRRVPLEMLVAISIISIHAPPRGATAKDMQFLQIFCSTLTNQHGLTIVPRNLSRLFW